MDDNLINQETEVILDFLKKIFSTKPRFKLNWKHYPKYIRGEIEKEYFDFVTLTPTTYFDELMVFGEWTILRNDENGYAIWKSPKLSEDNLEWIDELRLEDKISTFEEVINEKISIKNIIFLKGTYKSTRLIIDSKRYKKISSIINDFNTGNIVYDLFNGTIIVHSNCIQVLRVIIYIILLILNNNIDSLKQAKERYLVYYYSVIPPKYTKPKWEQDFFDENFNMEVKKQLIAYKSGQNIKDIKPKFYDAVLLYFYDTKKFLETFPKKPKEDIKIKGDELRGVDAPRFSQKQQTFLEKLFVNSIVQNKIKVVEFLLNKGIQINSSLPLNLACEYGHFKMSKLLLSHNLECNKKFAEELAFNNGNFEIVNLLNKNLY